MWKMNRFVHNFTGKNCRMTLQSGGHAQKSMAMLLLAMLKESLWTACKHVKVHVNMSGFTSCRFMSVGV